MTPFQILTAGRSGAPAASAGGIALPAALLAALLVAGVQLHLVCDLFCFHEAADRPTLADICRSAPFGG